MHGSSVERAPLRALEARLADLATGRFYEAMVEQSSDIIVAMDRDGRILYVSRAIERALGHRRPWTVVADAFAAVHPEDRARVEADFARKVDHPEEGEPLSFRMRHADGTWRWFEAAGTSLLDDPAVGAIVVSLRDVTTRVHAALEAQASAERYQTLVDVSPAPIAIHQDGRVVYTNQAAVELLGASQATEVLGRPIEDFIHPEFMAEVRERVERAVELGEPAPVVEEQLMRVDGTTLHVEIGAVPTMWAGAPAVQVVARDISGQKAAEHELREQASHDPLTGLPNRALVLDRLGRVLRDRSRPDFALAFLDLDRFKVVNDALGHAVGDDLLRAVADRLRTRVRDSDTLCRFGGDEFVVLLDGVGSPEVAERLVARLLEAFRGPFMVSDRPIQLSCSAGVVLGEDGPDADDLLRDADIAMYAAKRQGRSRLCRFDQGMRSAAEQRLELEQQLRDAFGHHQLVPWFQTEVDLRTGAVVGAEALARWEHPQRGVLGPDEFLPTLEDAGLARQLTVVMLDAACAAARDWAHDDGDLRWVSVNLNPLDLLTDRFAEQVGDCLARHGLPGVALCVEVTESSLISDPGAAATTIGQLRDLGIAVALDDFGTGYSSLSYLKRFQPDFLKIDRSFVADLTTDRSDLALVSAAIEMAAALDIRTIAEGVETDQQRSVLVELGCEIGQGWLFGRPVPNLP